MQPGDDHVGEVALLRQQDASARFGELALRSDDLDACHPACFAKQSNGEVAVDSIPGRGSTFTLYLPRHGSPVEQKVEPETAIVRRVPGESHCVLVVEDNDVRHFATEMPHDLGYRTVWAADAARALEMPVGREPHIDVVFSDVIMPGMNGIELGEAIRRLDPELPVILTSGHGSVLAEEGTHGFDLVHKPCSVEALAQAIRNAVAPVPC